MTTRKANDQRRPRQRRRTQPEPSWHQHAGFSIFFDRADGGKEDWQTRIYHDESDEEVVLKEAARDSWSGWIAQRAALPEEAPQERAPAEAAMPPTLSSAEVAPEMAPPEVALEVSKVMISESVPESGPTKTLTAELHFMLTGEKARDVAERHTPFRVETYAVDLESGDSLLVASEPGELQESVFEYTKEQVFPVPDLGRYEFHNLVVLLPPEETMAAHRGPVIEVVP